MPLPKPPIFTEPFSSAFKEALPQKLTLDEFKRRSTQVTEQLGSAIKEGVPREISVRQFKKSVRIAVLIALITPGSFIGLGAAGTYLVNQFRQTEAVAQDQSELQKNIPKEKFLKDLVALLPKLIGSSVAHGKGVERRKALLDDQEVEIDIQFNRDGDLIKAPFRIWDAEGGSLMYEGTLSLKPAQDGYALAQE